MHTRNITVGSQTISIETGRLAKQADGAVVVRCGDTMVLVTACADANPREGVDFLPLTCDYKENAYASGRMQAVPIRSSRCQPHPPPSPLPRGGVKPMW